MACKKVNYFYLNPFKTIPVFKNLFLPPLPILRPHSDGIEPALSALSRDEHEAGGDLLSQAGRQAGSHIPQGWAQAGTEEPDPSTQPVFFSQTGEEYIWPQRALGIHLQFPYNWNTLLLKMSMLVQIIHLKPLPYWYVLLMVSFWLDKFQISVFLLNNWKVAGPASQ